MPPSPKKPGIIQGTLDLLILRTLVFGPLHGHGIVKHIKSTTDEVLSVEHGSLYPALQRLEKLGCITSGWEVVDSGRELKPLPDHAKGADTTEGGRVEVGAAVRSDGPVAPPVPGATLMSRRDDDLEREIRQHLELEAEERAAEGLSADDARRAARRAFGNVTLTQEDARAVWLPIWMQQIAQDVRYAMRISLRSPAFTLGAVLVFSLGLGASTMILQRAECGRARADALSAARSTGAP